MDKTAIKNFAIYARNKLIQATKDKAASYGVTKEEITNPVSRGTGYEIYKTPTGAEITLDSEEIEQRRSLVTKVRQDGFDNTIEEVAYTWFNRLIAVRFMEVNNYLPSRLRVLSSEIKGKKESDLMSRPFDAGFFYTNEDGLYINEYLEKNNTNELFKLLFIKQCNELSNILPGLFEKTNDYTELLFNTNYNDPEDVVYKLVNEIPESNFNVEQEGQIEIIGWLYQFYNIEPKNKAFASKEKTTKNEIPAVTQLFTPDWIVRYMVENSLGRLWVDGHPNEELKSNWKYYLEEAEQEESVKEQFQKIKDEHSKLQLEEIKVIDPCMGSGHILVYAFDVLMQIYRAEGWTDRDAVESILKNNLYGLDIDERAYQLSYFAVMMKAREYNRRVFTQGIIPNVYAIKESNNITTDQINSFGSNNKELIYKLVKLFKDAKELGSLIKVTLTKEEITKLDSLIEEMETMSSYGSLLAQVETENKIDLIYPLVRQARLLSDKYDVVVTNPPYLPVSTCEDSLKAYIIDNYPDSKTDLFATFIEKCCELIKENAYQSMITMHSWMFLTSYEKLRRKLYYDSTVISMAHLGARAFEEIGGEVVQTAAFVLLNGSINKMKGTYVRLVDYNSEKAKEAAFLKKSNVYYSSQLEYRVIPGNPLVYWASSRIIALYSKNNLLNSVVTTKQGLKSSDDKRFFKLWYEVIFNKIGFGYTNATEARESNKKWIPLNKGGTQKWYGDYNYLVNWENDGEEIKAYAKKLYNSVTRTITSIDYYFKKCITWPQITSSPSFRMVDNGFIFNAAGPSMFINDNDFIYILGLLNTKIVKNITSMLNPTVNLCVTDMLNIPFIMSEKNKCYVEQLTEESILLAHTDWDSFETSWDFKVHPLVRWNKELWDSTAIAATMHKWYGETIKVKSPLELCYLLWQGECNERFNQLKANEEELNRIFIDIYGLQDELSPEIEDKDVTVRKADLQRDIKSLISYAVGCMFGRYSLDEEGLAYAGGDFNPYKYRSFRVDRDNIIPIRDEEYYEEDDIVSRFVEFIKVVYGEDTLEENLTFIAKALKPESTLSSREVIRQYFLNDFFKDHCQTYQVTGSGKRPIYWLFDSGKQNGFKALIYMHRYDENTVAKVRTDYLHKVQSFYENGIANDEYTIDHSTVRSDVTKATKHRDKLVKQLEETKLYDQALAHIANQRISIDLDDGVKVNYAKFQEVEVINEGSKKVKVNLLASIK